MGKLGTNMSCWNYRVVRKVHSDGTSMLGLHEAYYDDNGKVWGITNDPQEPVVEEKIGCAPDLPGETVEDLKQVLKWMLEACEKPILDADSIPESGAEDPLEKIDLKGAEEWDSDKGEWVPCVDEESDE